MYIYQYLSWCVHHHCPGCLQQKLWVDQVEVACPQRITLWEAEGKEGGGGRGKGGEERGEGERREERGERGGRRGRGKRGRREERGEREEEFD